MYKHKYFFTSVFLSFVAKLMQRAATSIPIAPGGELNTSSNNCKNALLLMIFLN